MVTLSMSGKVLLNEARRRQLVIVSGKGGVGKTSVSVALGLAASRAGSRVLLVEIDPYGRMPAYLGVAPPGAEPTLLGSRLAAVRIDPARALEEFLGGLLRFRRLTERLLASSTFRVVTAAAPGLESFLTLRKIMEFQRGSRSRRGKLPRFDMVIVDAPSTGHSIPLLSTPAAIMKMVPFGPLARGARELALNLTDRRRTAVLIVTLAEEVVINETSELIEAVSRLGMDLLPPVVNATVGLRFSPREASRLTLSPPSVPGEFLPAVAAARFHLNEQRRAEREIRRLRRGVRQRPVLLPVVAPGEAEAAAVQRLAGVLLGLNGRRK